MTDRQTKLLVIIFIALSFFHSIILCSPFHLFVFFFLPYLYHFSSSFYLISFYIYLISFFFSLFRCFFSFSFFIPSFFFPALCTVYNFAVVTKYSLKQFCLLACFICYLLHDFFLSLKLTLLLLLI